MKTRKMELGTRNIIGARVEQIAKSKGMKQKDLLKLLREKGLDLNASALSKVEGQIRMVADYELVALAQVLEVSVEHLLGLEE